MRKKERKKETMGKIFWEIKSNLEKTAGRKSMKEKRNWKRLIVWNERKKKEMNEEMNEK